MSTQYDRWAATYDRHWRRHTARTHEALLAGVDLGDAVSVLDVGCGTGELVRRLHARWPHLHITGVEPSAGMRRVAVAKLAQLVTAGAHLTILAGGAMALPAADGSVDCVALASVLHYLPTPLAALAEARRVLRPGGHLLVVDYVPRCLPRTLADAIIRLYDRAHRHTRSPAALANLLTNAGFSIHGSRTFALYPCLGGAAFHAMAPGAGPSAAHCGGRGAESPRQAAATEQGGASVAGIRRAPCSPGRHSSHADDKEELMAQPTPDHGLAAGTPAPEFSLPAINGHAVSLAALRTGSPVLLVFYRGWW